MACNIYTTIRRMGVSRAFLSSVATQALAAAGHPRADVSVHCVGEARIQSLNAQYRGIEAPTDVLSFPTDKSGPTRGQSDAGDIFLCPAYIRTQATRFHVPFREEIARMLIHGVLHVLGHDHTKKKEAAIMFRLQERILSHII